MKLNKPLSIDLIFVKLINIAVQYPLLRTNNLEFFVNFTDQLFFHINLFLTKSEKLSH